MLRVWTINAFGPPTVWTDGMTRRGCERWIVGRWGHWPPFAVISGCKNRDSFEARYWKGR